MDRFPQRLFVVMALTMLAAACSTPQDPATGSTNPPPATSTALPTTTQPTAVDAVTPEPAATPLDAHGAGQANSEANCPSHGSTPTNGRTDILPSGNRQAPGGINLLAASAAVIELPAPALWIVPTIDQSEPCEPHWYAALDDGQAVTVSADGIVRDAGPAVTPPESTMGGIASAHARLDQFEDPLPDGRVVSFGRWTAALVGPTDRYPHGVLGDRIEASGVQIIDTQSGDAVMINIDAPTVIEGISPMLIDVDQADDAVPEVLITLSNAQVGAWLALYDITGTLRAESDPIGQGNRWRNQLGAGPTGPNGAYEIIDVRTPHLSGVVEFFQVRGNRLERVAMTSGYTNHVIGSRNLDLGILVNADNDTLLEVVLPTRDLRSIVVLDRTEAGVVERGRIELDGQLNTNIATQSLDGQPWLALGTSDGRLLVFGDAAEHG